MIPRPYQQDAVDKASKKLRSPGRTYIVVPTGGGKTGIAGFYINQRRSSGKRPKRILVLQHTDELIKQNRATIARIVYPDATAEEIDRLTSIVKAEKNGWDGEIVFASVPTLTRARRLAQIAKFTDVIVDECHHVGAKGWTKVLERCVELNKHLRILGLTATDGRADGKSLADLLGSCAHRIFIQELIDLGHLVPPRAFTINLGVQAALEAAKLSNGDYDQGKAAKVLNTPEFNTEVIAQWEARGKGRRTVAFTTTKEHGLDLRDAFRAAGHRAETISDETPEGERSDIIERFDRGDIDVLTNCMVLTEGFDCQPTSCIIVLRPMLHVGTFIQALGRGLRTVDPERYPDEPPKIDCVLLDFTGAAVRHQALDEKTMIAPMAIPRGELGEPANDNERNKSAGSPEPEAMDTTGLDLVEIDLRQSPFRWSQVRPDSPATMAVGFEGYAALIPYRGYWIAIGRRRPKDGPRFAEPFHLIAIGTLSQARARADDFMNEAETSEHSHASKRWLDQPMTAKQRAILCRFPSFDSQAPVSRYLASCLITYNFERRSILDFVRRSGAAQIDLLKRAA